jgi:hypothetical protein
MEAMQNAEFVTELSEPEWAFLEPMLPKPTRPGRPRAPLCRDRPVGIELLSRGDIERVHGASKSGAELWGPAPDPGPDCRRRFRRYRCCKTTPSALAASRERFESPGMPRAKPRGREEVSLGVQEPPSLPVAELEQLLLIRTTVEFRGGVFQRRCGDAAAWEWLPQGRRGAGKTA